jgi:acyl-CoA synthetase (AMP-forming)/AMP-acid ligase II
VPKPGCALETGEIIEFLRVKLARWALPDGVEVIDTVPKTSVGKSDEKVLRECYKNWAPGVI